MPKITFTKTNQTLEIAAGGSFLEFCQDNDAPHDFGCTVGSCGTCVCLIVAGAGNLSPMDDEERETVEMCSGVEGARLGCQIKVLGDVTIQQPVD